MVSFCQLNLKEKEALTPLIFYSSIPNIFFNLNLSEIMCIDMLVCTFMHQLNQSTMNFNNSCEEAIMKSMSEQVRLNNLIDESSNSRFFMNYHDLLSICLNLPSISVVIIDDMFHIPSNTLILLKTSDIIINYKLDYIFNNDILFRMKNIEILDLYRNSKSKNLILSHKRDCNLESDFKLSSFPPNESQINDDFLLCTFKIKKTLNSLVLKLDAKFNSVHVSFFPETISQVLLCIKRYIDVRLRFQDSLTGVRKFSSVLSISDQKNLHN